MASTSPVPAGSASRTSYTSQVCQPRREPVSSGAGGAAATRGVGRDIEIIDRLLADDESVLRDVFEVYGEQIAFVLHRASSGFLRREEIEDVLNITVYRLWRCRRRFSPEKGRFKTWLLGIARVVAWEYRKSRWCAQRQNECALASERLETLAVASGTAPSVDVVEEQDARDVLCDKVRQALSSLPSNYAKVLWAFASATEGEVTSGMLAAEMGLTASTIRVYRKRGLAMLKARLECEGIVVSPDARDKTGPQRLAMCTTVRDRRAAARDTDAKPAESFRPEPGAEPVTRLPSIQ